MAHLLLTVAVVVAALLQTSSQSSVANAVTSDLRLFSIARFTESPASHYIELDRLTPDYGHQSSVLARDTYPTEEIGVIPGGFSVNITIAGIEYPLILDTGSSATWIVGPDVTCIDYNGALNNGSACGFPTFYLPDDSFHRRPNEYFGISYQDGHITSGYLGETLVELAGMDIQNQTIAVAQITTAYSGDTTAGVLGLAFSSLNVHSDISGTGFPSIPDSVFSQNITHNSSIFSLALSRDSSHLMHGGQLLFGGLPDASDNRINTSMVNGNDWVLMYMLEYGIEDNEYGFYTVTIDNTTAASTTIPNHYRGVISQQRYIIDSGTTTNVFRSDIAREMNSWFNPPATQHNNTWYLECNATAPRIGLGIAGHILYMNPVDMVIPSSDPAYCYSAIQGLDRYGGDGDDVGVLGEPFLKNVLAIFDWNTTIIGFVPREWYES